MNDVSPPSEPSSVEAPVIPIDATAVNPADEVQFGVVVEGRGIAPDASSKDLVAYVKQMDDPDVLATIAAHPNADIEVFEATANSDAAWNDDGEPNEAILFALLEGAARQEPPSALELALMDTDDSSVLDFVGPAVLGVTDFSVILDASSMTEEEFLALPADVQQDHRVNQFLGGIVELVIENPNVDSDTLYDMTELLIGGGLSVSFLMVDLLENPNTPESVLFDFGLSFFAGGTHAETGEPIDPIWSSLASAPPEARAMYDAIVHNDNTSLTVIQRMEASSFGVQLQIDDLFDGNAPAWSDMTDENGNFSPTLLVENGWTDAGGLHELTTLMAGVGVNELTQDVWEGWT